MFFIDRKCLHIYTHTHTYLQLYKYLLDVAPFGGKKIPNIFSFSQMPFSPLRKRKRNWKASLEKLQALLTCALCNNHPLKYPVTLSTCCHAFCESCIKENFSNCCPICHKPAILQYPSAVQVPNICNIVQLLAKLRESADMFSFDRTTNRKTIITDNDMHWTGRKTEQQSYLSNRPLGMHAPSMEKLQGASKCQLAPLDTSITCIYTSM